MVKRVIRIIGYLILLLANLWLLWFFHSFLNLAILVVMVFLPVLSILGAGWVASKLTAELEGPYESMEKGEEFQVKLKLHNPAWLGVMGCTVLVQVENAFYGTKRIHELRVPLRARNGQTITYPVTVEKCGRIEFSIQRISLADFLGLTSFHREFPQKYTVSVLPKPTGDLDRGLNGYTEGMTEVEEGTRKGSDFSEVQDIREYQPGDRIQNIHWKLSMKKDVLMVKERVSLSSRQLFLMLELHDNDMGQMEEVLDCTAGITDELLKNRVPFSLVWWSVKTGELISWKVDYREQLEEGFRRIYYEDLYEEQALGREMYRRVYGEEAQFLWIGNRNHGNGEALTEYGRNTGVFYGAVS